MGNDELSPENLLSIPDRDALDKIFTAIDDLLLVEEFGAVDYILSRVDCDRLTPVLLLGFLSISCAAKSLLKEYRPLFERVHQSLVLEPNREELLRGLEP